MLSLYWIIPLLIQACTEYIYTKPKKIVNHNNFVSYCFVDEILFFEINKFIFSLG